jgi:hypothetical protein
MRVLAAGLLLAACSGQPSGDLATYVGHGFAFQHPSALAVVELPSSGVAPSGDSGQLRAGEDTNDPRERFEAIGVAWVRVAFDQGEIPAAQERGIAGALDGAEERGDFGITHRGQLHALARDDGRLAYQTFSGRPDQGRRVYGTAGSLYCPDGGRLFVLGGRLFVMVVASNEWGSESRAAQAFERYFAALRC